MYALPPTKDYYCQRSVVIHQVAITCMHLHLQKTIIVSEVQLFIRLPSHIHTSNYKRLLLSQKCSYSSGCHHIYTLPTTKGYYCLRSAVIHQAAIKCTHFHLQKTIIVSEVQLFIRLPSHVRTSTYKRLLLSQNCSYLSGCHHMYALPRTKDYYYLRSAVIHQAAITCTLFHLLTLCVTQIALTGRLPNVHTFTCKTLLLKVSNIFPLISSKIILYCLKLF